VSAFPTPISVHAMRWRTILTTLTDGLRSVYRTEGIRGLYKGSLLTLAGTANGSIQFATYEEIKRRRAEMKRKRYQAHGREWHTEDEKLVSAKQLGTLRRGPTIRSVASAMLWSAAVPSAPETHPLALGPPLSSLSSETSSSC
jgi:hypothetical protein